MRRQPCNRERVVCDKAFDSGGVAAAWQAIAAHGLPMPRDRVLLRYAVC